MARRSSLVSSISLSCLFATIGLAAEPPDGTVRWRSTQPVDAGGTNGDYAWAAAADDRGRLVAIGDAATATVGRMVVMRRTATGDPDPTFGGPAGLVVNPFGLVGTSTGRAIAVQRDGRILVTGSHAANGNVDFLVGRLLADGQPDPSFSGDGWLLVPFDRVPNGVDVASGIAVDIFGRIVVGGTACWSGSDCDFAVARLGSNGQLDPNFGNGGKVSVAFDLPGSGLNDVAAAVAVDLDTRIVLAGSAESAGPAANRMLALLRLLQSGALDLGFGTAGKVVVDSTAAIDGNYDQLRALVIRPDGRIVAAGESYRPPATNALALQLLPTGALDASFGGGLRLIPFCQVSTGSCVGPPLDSANGIAVQGDGGLLVAGRSTRRPTSEDDFGFARLRPNGTLDPGFGDSGTLQVDLEYGVGTHDDTAYGLALVAGRPVAFGPAEWNGLDFDFGFVQVAEDLVFADGFESGFYERWSSWAGASLPPL